MTGVEFGRGAAMEVHGVPRKTRQQIETRLDNGTQVTGRRTRGLKDIGVVGFVEFDAREPEEVADMQTKRIELGVWPLCHRLTRVGGLPRRSGRLRAAGRRWYRQQWFRYLGNGGKRQQADHQREKCGKSAFHYSVEELQAGIPVQHD